MISIEILKERHPEDYKEVNIAIKRYNKYELFAISYVEDVPLIGRPSLKHIKQLRDDLINHYIDLSTNSNGFQSVAFNNHIDKLKFFYDNFFQELRNTGLSIACESVHPYRIAKSLCYFIHDKQESLSDLKKLPYPFNIPDKIEWVLSFNEDREYSKAVLYTSIYSNLNFYGISPRDMIIIVNRSLIAWQEVFTKNEINLREKKDAQLLLEAFGRKLNKINPKKFSYPYCIPRSFEEVLFIADDLFETDIEKRIKFIREAKQLCATKKYELKTKHTKQKNFRLDNKTIRQLDELSKTHRLSNTEVIDLLIRNEHEHQLYLSAKY